MTDQKLTPEYLISWFERNIHKLVFFYYQAGAGGDFLIQYLQGFHENKFFSSGEVWGRRESDQYNLTTVTGERYKINRFETNEWLFDNFFLLKTAIWRQDKVDTKELINEILNYINTDIELFETIDKYDKKVILRTHDYIPIHRCELLKGARFIFMLDDNELVNYNHLLARVKADMRPRIGLNSESKKKLICSIYDNIEEIKNWKFKLKFENKPTLSCSEMLTKLSPIIEDDSKIFCDALIEQAKEDSSIEDLSNPLWLMDSKGWWSQPKLINTIPPLDRLVIKHLILQHSKSERKQPLANIALANIIKNVKTSTKAEKLEYLYSFDKYLLEEKKNFGNYVFYSQLEMDSSDDWLRIEFDINTNDWIQQRKLWYQDNLKLLTDCGMSFEQIDKVRPDILENVGQRNLVKYFGEDWRPDHDLYKYSGYALQDEVSPQETVLDVGCGFNLMKPHFGERLYGIDIVNKHADEVISIEDFQSDKKWDVAFCLGSINFGDIDIIAGQIRKMLGFVKDSGRIYWRQNPGVADHPWRNCTTIDFFDWTIEKNYLLAKKFNCEVLECKWDTRNRIYAVWQKNTS